MKKNAFVIGILSAALAFTGACKKSAEEKRDEAAEDVRDKQQDLANTQREAREDIAEAKKEANEDIAEAKKDVAEAKNDLADARDAWVRDNRDRLAKLDAKIDQLEAKGDAESKKQAARLRAERDSIKGDVDKAEDRANTNWEQFKSGVDKRWENLKADLDDDDNNDGK